MARRVKTTLVAALAVAALGAPVAAHAVVLPSVLPAVAGALPTWLNPGPDVQYPSAGGTWEYGFWNAKVRSYYTVNRCHGSTVVLNGSQARSADTASGRKSVAEKWAVNIWSNDDAYYYRTC
ncbi:lactococcin 972 family bacteriocin [Oerskovia turbata]